MAFRSKPGDRCVAGIERLETRQFLSVVTHFEGGSPRHAPAEVRHAAQFAERSHDRSGSLRTHGSVANGFHDHFKSAGPWSDFSADASPQIFVFIPVAAPPVYRLVITIEPPVGAVTQGPEQSPPPSREQASGGPPVVAETSDNNSRPQEPPRGNAAAVTMVEVDSPATTVTAPAADEVLAGSAFGPVVAAAAGSGAAVVGAASQAVLLAAAEGFFSVIPFISAEDAAGHHSPEATTVTDVVEAVVRGGGEVIVVAPGNADPVQAALKSAADKLLPRRFFHIPRIDAAAAFNDAMAAFVDESALTPADATSRRTRGWALTGVVIVADVALLAYWYRTRSRKAAIGIVRRPAARRHGRSPGTRSKSPRPGPG
jgi:hypothetical protein